MIDRIRQDIEQRLEQLLAEADRLREALSALGSTEGNGNRASRRSSPSRRSARRTGARAGGASASSPAGTSSRAGGASATSRAGGRSQAARRRTAGQRPARTPRAASGRKRAGASRDGGGRTRTASGATRRAVLDALAKSEQPLTAGQVASATGLGRPSVSTTLSKLARSGDVSKAQRGYTLGARAG